MVGTNDREYGSSTPSPKLFLGLAVAMFVIAGIVLVGFVWPTNIGGIVETNDFTEAENATGTSAEWQNQWQLAASSTINVGHVFEGDPLKVRSRLRAAEAIGNNPGSPNGGCFYRPTSSLHTEAVIVRWLFSATYAGTAHVYDGAIFLQNISEPDRSTIIPNGSGKNSVPADFEKIDSSDPKCSAAVQFFVEFVRVINLIIGNGIWPGLPLT